MPEDVAPEETLDTPDAPEPSGPEDTGTPADGPADGDAKRIADFQAIATKAQQEAAEFRQLFSRLDDDPDLQREFLRRWNYEVEEAEDEDDPEDTDEPLTRAQFEAYLNDQKAKQAEDQQLDATANEMGTQLAGLEKEHGEFSPEEWETIIDVAIAHPDEDGKPDVKAAHQRLEAAAETRNKRYLKSKKSDVVAVGQAGSEKIDMSDDESVTDAFANLIEAERQV